MRNLLSDLVAMAIVRAYSFVGIISRTEWLSGRDF